MSIPSTFAQRNAALVARARTQNRVESPVALMLPTSQHAAAITSEDLSALLTIVPVGILAFITFGLLLSPF
ncbi:MAG TPA: hypothetical protein VFG34_10155 [Sphingopyxis sp.]|nr:hypothetical protein [Sphingopyxis sp.]